MLINNLDIVSFKSQLLKKEIQTAEVVVFDDWLRNALSPVYLGKQEKYRQLKLQLLIKDIDDESALSDIGKLVKQFEKCTIKFDDLSFYYDCLIVNKSHTRVIKGRYTLDVELKSGCAYKAVVTETLNRMTTKAMTVLGNLSSPAVVTITPSIDTILAIITGLTSYPITLSNLHANNPITIDGEKCTVTELDFDSTITVATGLGKWNWRKYTMWRFVNPDNCNVPFAPKYADIPVGTPYSQALIPDGADLVKNTGYDYLGHAKTAVYVASPVTKTFTFYHDDGATVYLNGVVVYEYIGPKGPSTTVTLNLIAGWNVLEILLIQHFGPDYISNITPIIGSLVTTLNCYYSKAGGTPGIVNKFGETDMWAFPTLNPGANTVGISITTADVSIAYKPRFL